MSGNPNMVFCRGCGQTLHVTAVTCPHCGAPQKLVGMAGQGDGIARSFGGSISLCFSKYATFKGRAPRAEYWWFILFSCLVYLALAVLAVLLNSDGIRVVGGLVELVFLLPSLAVTVRRLHDVDRSAWWLLLYFLPVIGAIVMLVWFCTRGTSGANRFGPENGSPA